MSRARRSSASASAVVSPAMPASASPPPPALRFLRAIGRSLRRQQAFGLGPRLGGDLGAGQHARNLLAPGRSLRLVECG